jgi:ankyrin repeat protein
MITWRNTLSFELLPLLNTIRNCGTGALLSAAVVCLPATLSAQDACGALTDPSLMTSADFAGIVGCLSEGQPLPPANEAGFTPLHLAAGHASDPFIIAHLVASGADVRAGADCQRHWRNGYLSLCTEPLHLAAARPDGFAVVAALLALGADRGTMDAEWRSPAAINRLAAEPSKDVLALLAQGDWRDQPESRPETSSNASAACDSFLSAEFFAAADVDEVAACLAQDARPTATDRQGNTALHLAAANSADPRVIDLLLHHLGEADADAPAAPLRLTNLNGDMPLHVAARSSNSAAIMNRLLAWGAEVDALTGGQVDGHRSTALHIVAKRKGNARVQMLPVLLAHGAKAAAQDQEGRQALLWLARVDPDPALVTLLLQAELRQRAFYECRIGSCSVHDEAGISALHAAAYADAPESVVALLLGFGFDPDRADREGVTPLMRFAQHGTNPAVFLQVLERSANPCRPSSQGLLVEAFLRKNESLMECDPVGTTWCPLEAYKQRCP